MISKTTSKNCTIGSTVGFTDESNEPLATMSIRFDFGERTPDTVVDVLNDLLEQFEKIFSDEVSNVLDVSYPDDE